MIGLIVYQDGEWINGDNPDIRTTCPECGAHITPEEAEAGTTFLQALIEFEQYISDEGLETIRYVVSLAKRESEVKEG